MYHGTGLHFKVNGIVSPVRKQGMITLPNRVRCAFGKRKRINKSCVGNIFMKAVNNPIVLQNTAGGKKYQKDNKNSNPLHAPLFSG
jgi:hypothetical protein